MRFWKAVWDFEWGMASIGAGLCLLAMMTITVVSVFGRYVLQMDLIPGAYNIIERIVFPLLVFWALPMAHREGAFPKLELVQESLPEGLRRAVALLVMAVEIAVYLVIMWFVVRFVWAGIESNRSMQVGTNFWPLWPIIIMIPLAFGLMVLEMIRLFAEDLRAVLRGGEG
ncbi:MAG: TRAP transporter small permease [Rhizobiaceae bacterium]|nr:TRAP transporter small permease [Rhizobiaceae bacterium]MCV0409016.1 TRAP transporter small permease [Rhizobiaceae bacterium]